MNDYTRDGIRTIGRTEESSEKHLVEIVVDREVGGSQVKEGANAPNIGCTVYLTEVRSALARVARTENNQ